MNFTTSRMVIDESQGKESNRSFGVLTEKEALYIFKKTVDDKLGGYRSIFAHKGK